jgi:hypothetical protein
VAITCDLIEERLGAFATHHPIRHGIGMLLVRIAGPADAALELDSAALLDHVGSLVRRSMQARWV